MNPIIKAAAVAASMLLGGCAVYEPAYGGYPYSQPAPVYVDQSGYYYPPAPIYAQPAPVYVEPPVRFGFSLKYWSGSRHHGHHHRGGGHRFGGHGWGGHHRHR